MESSMTVVIGAFSDDATDVVIACDRQRCNENIETGDMIPIPDLLATKSLRVNQHCCIACGGLPAMANQVYAGLFDHPEWRGIQPDLDAAQIFHDDKLEYVNVGVQEVISYLNSLSEIAGEWLAGMREKWLYAVIAGKGKGEQPELYAWGLRTQWMCQPFIRQPVFGIPLSGDEKTEFEKLFNEAGASLEDRISHAIWYAAQHSESVNQKIVIRRWSDGFDFATMEAFPSNSPTQNPSTQPSCADEST